MFCITRVLRVAGPLAVGLTACQLDVHRAGGSWAPGIHCDLPARAERTERLDLPLRDGELLAITTGHGPIEVRPSAQGSKLEATLAIAGRTELEATKALAGFRVVARRTGSGVEVSVEGGPYAFRDHGSLVQLQPRVRFVARVPESTRLYLASGSGTILARGSFATCIA